MSGREVFAGQKAEEMIQELVDEMFACLELRLEFEAWADEHEQADETEVQH